MNMSNVLASFYLAYSPLIFGAAICHCSPYSGIQKMPSAQIDAKILAVVVGDD